MSQASQERYPQVLRAISETPIAMLRGSFEVMLDIVGHRLSGERFSKEEIEARVGSRASSSPSSVVGSVAVLPIYGAIIPKATLFSDMSGGTSIEQLQEDFRGALADEAVKAIVFDVDSPGGMVTMVPEFASEIRAARGQKPMVAVASPRAASAAYWLASQADEFVATPSGDVGSIGVFNAHQDVSAMQEKMGVKTTYVSAGKYKTEGNASEPLSDEAIAAIQARVDEMYDVFTGDVAKARGVSVQAVKNGYGEGRMLSAAKALAEGMIDRVDTLEHVVSLLQNPSGRARVASKRAEALDDELAAHGGVVTVAFTGTTTSPEGIAGGAVIQNLGAGLGPTFTDEVEEAHRALEAVVTRAEELRSLTGTKREQIAGLVERGQQLLAQSEPQEEPVAVDELEIEFALAAAGDRLRGLETNSERRHHPMSILEKDDVAAWDKPKVEKELRDRRNDVASIVESKGMTLGQSGWLAKLDTSEAERVTEHQRSLVALGERLDEIQATERTEGQFAKLGEFLDAPDPNHDHPGHSRAKTMERNKIKPIEEAQDVGALFAASDALKAYLASGTFGKTVSVPVGSIFGPGIEGIGEMPALEGALFDSTGFPSRPDYRDDALVPTLYQMNNIGPLMPQGSTDSDTIKYPVETVTATGATEVAEGNTKPEAQISFADTTEPVQTIAVLLPMTTRSLTNQPFLRAYINARLRLFVQMREDAQLLNGNGTTPNIKGIFNRSGINTATSYSIGGANPDQALVEAIFHASMRVQDAFLPPDAAVMKGSTWELARLAKDANRNYLLGPANEQGPAYVWGLKVVINANMPAQSAGNKNVLVGAWAASAMVVRRGGIELALAEQHSTFFAENKVMLRAEEEVALCVFRPAGFAAVTSAS